MTNVSKAALKAAAAALAATESYQHLGKSGPATLEAVLSVADSGAQAALLKSLGVGGGGGGETGGNLSVESKLDLLAKKRSSESGITYAKAYSQILASTEGRALGEAARWESLPDSLQLQYAEHFANVLQDGAQTTASHNSNDALRALDGMARNLMKQRCGMKFESAYDSVLQTTEGARLYKMHTDSVALRLAAKG